MKAHWFSATSPESVERKVGRIPVHRDEPVPLGVPPDREVADRRRSRRNAMLGRTVRLRPGACPSSRRARAGRRSRSTARPGSGGAARVGSSGGRQPRPKSALDILDLGDRDALLVVVGEVRVARAVVDRGHAESGEPRDIGPAVLRLRRRADRRDELSRERRRRDPAARPPRCRRLRPRSRRTPRAHAARLRRPSRLGANR